ncbi:MAG: hypothetical protein JWR32_255 [Mycobacterium sp.]|jgi:hypothetical protein|nr:hypothetical protein [Mycobacterium sp.]
MIRALSAGRARAYSCSNPCCSKRRVSVFSLTIRKRKTEIMVNQLCGAAEIYKDATSGREEERIACGGKQVSPKPFHPRGTDERKPCSSPSFGPPKRLWQW